MSKFTSISKTIKGGEKMRTFGLVLALVMVIGGSCFAAEATIDLYTGFNLISCPLVPLDPAPSAVFGMTNEQLDAAGLMGYDSVNGSDSPYSKYDYGVSFGGMLLGNGYWVSSSTGEYGNARVINYQGVENGVPTGTTKTDMWISLPGVNWDGNDFDRNNDGSVDGGGWNLIGNPYATEVPKANFRFTDGTEVKTWAEAVAAKWVADNLQGYDGTWQSGQTLYLNYTGDTDVLVPARGYYLETFKDNLAMIILAPAN